MSRTRYINSETFLAMTPVSELDGDTERLLVLDGYAFDVEELAEYGKNTLQDFYKNPHVNTTDFSEEAKKQLREHPTLRKYADALDNELLLQKHHIQTETVDIVLTMLQELNRAGLTETHDPRLAFVAHKASLSDLAQKNLDEYIIRVPCSPLPRTTSTVVSGEAFFHSSTATRMAKNQPTTTKSMRFADAIVGGNAAQPCLKTLQVFLWQFVLDFKPSAQSLIPFKVKQLAKAEQYILAGKQGAPVQINLDKITEEDSPAPSPRKTPLK